MAESVCGGTEGDLVANKAKFPLQTFTLNISKQIQHWCRPQKKKKVLFVTPIFVLSRDQGLPITHSETAQTARHKSPWHGHKH